LKIKRYQKVIYGIILAVAIVWCAGILLAPVWGACGDECHDFRGDVSGVLYSFYSKSCHQLDDRSFHIAGYKLGVCSRCTFIYFAFLLSTVIYPFTRRLNITKMPSVWILLAGAALVGLDAGLDIFDVVKNTSATREITGAILGAILPFYIIPGTIRVFDEFFSPQSR
jgi:uncharacterized membrane protein